MGPGHSHGKPALRSQPDAGPEPVAAITDVWGREPVLRMSVFVYVKSPAILTGQPQDTIPETRTTKSLPQPRRLLQPGLETSVQGGCVQTPRPPTHSAHRISIDVVGSPGTQTPCPPRGQQRRLSEEARSFKFQGVAASRRESKKLKCLILCQNEPRKDLTGRAMEKPCGLLAGVAAMPAEVRAMWASLPSSEDFERMPRVSGPSQ